VSSKLVSNVDGINRLGFKNHQYRMKGPDRLDTRKQDEAYSESVR
jgi:hypothetical protein